MEKDKSYVKCPTCEAHCFEGVMNEAAPCVRCDKVVCAECAREPGDGTYICDVCCEKLHELSCMI